LCELLLELDSESDTLPLEAEPALEADEAMLSACAVKAKPSAPMAAIKRKEHFINISSTRQMRNFTPQKAGVQKEISPNITESGI
jgi:hypothetical protein